MRTEQSHSRMSRRAAGIVAAIAGGALLLGGTTYALWTANASLAGGTITDGNLDVAAFGTPTYYDVSQDRSDTTANVNAVTGLRGHTIAALTSYSIVPGDVLQSNFSYVVALKGDNLVGALNTTLAGGTSAGAGVTFTGQAFLKTGSTWTAVSTPIALTPGSATPVNLGYVQAANELNGTIDAGSIPVIATTTVPATPAVADVNITVVVTATFASSTTNRDLATLTSALGNVTVNLLQTRTAGVGNFQ